MRIDRFSKSIIIGLIVTLFLSTPLYAATGTEDYVTPETLNDLFVKQLGKAIPEDLKNRGEYVTKEVLVATMASVARLPQNSYGVNWLLDGNEVSSDLSGRVGAVMFTNLLGNMKGKKLSPYKEVTLREVEKAISDLAVFTKESKTAGIEVYDETKSYKDNTINSSVSMLTGQSMSNLVILGDLYIQNNPNGTGQPVNLFNVHVTGDVILNQKYNNELKLNSTNSSYFLNVISKYSNSLILQGNFNKITLQGIGSKLELLNATQVKLLSAETDASTITLSNTAKIETLMYGKQTDVLGSGTIERLDKINYQSNISVSSSVVVKRSETVPTVTEVGIPVVSTLLANGYIEVTLSSKTPGAVIQYRTTRSDVYTKYTAPFIVTGNVSVEAYAERDGMTQSPYLRQFVSLDNNEGGTYAVTTNSGLPVSKYVSVLYDNIANIQVDESFFVSVLGATKVTYDEVAMVLRVEVGTVKYVIPQGLISRVNGSQVYTIFKNHSILDYISIAVDPIQKKIVLQKTRSEGVDEVAPSSNYAGLFKVYVNGEITSNVYVNTMYVDTTSSAEKLYVSADFFGSVLGSQLSWYDPSANKMIVTKNNVTYEFLNARRFETTNVVLLDATSKLDYKTMEINTTFKSIYLTTDKVMVQNIAGTPQLYTIRENGVDRATQETISVYIDPTYGNYYVPVSSLSKFLNVTSAVIDPVTNEYVFTRLGVTRRLNISMTTFKRNNSEYYIMLDGLKTLFNYTTIDFDISGKRITVTADPVYLP